MLRRFAVIVFQTIAAPQGGRAEERGGGVCFVPIDDRAGWPGDLAQLAREHFRHAVGRSVEVGIATLDEELLGTVCQRRGELYWQGGDH